VVPARLASTRFPRKPLADVGGLPLVVRSARRAVRAGCFERVVVASEDAEIVEVVRGHGLEALLTPAFETGTDRVAWAARSLGAHWVVNLQGDEPIFPLDLLRDIAARLPDDPDCLWTAADLALSETDRRDEDVVKIVLDPVPRPGSESLARDFHRILPDADPAPPPLAVHVGIYAGSTTALTRFAALPASRRETERRIEPLRALDAGMRVRALVGKWKRVAVDRMEHISRVLDYLHEMGE